MSRMTEEKRIHKRRSEQEMRDALQAFLEKRHILHIPPDDDDPDIVLYDAINELLAAQQIIASSMSGQVDDKMLELPIILTNQQF